MPQGKYLTPEEVAKRLATTTTPPPSTDVPNSIPVAPVKSAQIQARGSGIDLRRSKGSFIEEVGKGIVDPTNRGSVAGLVGGALGTAALAAEPAGWPVLAARLAPVIGAVAGGAMGKASVGGSPKESIAEGAKQGTYELGGHIVGPLIGRAGSTLKGVSERVARWLEAHSLQPFLRDEELRTVIDPATGRYIETPGEAVRQLAEHSLNTAGKPLSDGRIPKVRENRTGKPDAYYNLKDRVGALRAEKLDTYSNAAKNQPLESLVDRDKIFDESSFDRVRAQIKVAPDTPGGLKDMGETLADYRNKEGMESALLDPKYVDDLVGGINSAIQKKYGEKSSDASIETLKQLAANMRNAINEVVDVKDLNTSMHNLIPIKEAKRRATTMRGQTFQTGEVSSNMRTQAMSVLRRPGLESGLAQVMNHLNKLPVGMGELLREVPQLSQFLRLLIQRSEGR